MAVPVLRPATAAGRALLGLAATLVAVPAHAIERFDLYKPFGEFAIMEPQPIATGDGTPPSYGSTGPAPTWSIGQWDMPGGKLSPFVRTEGTNGADVTFRASSAEAKVELVRHARGAPALDFVQDGAVLPCLTAAGEPRESDLFFGPNGHAIVPDGVTAMTRHGADNPALTAYLSLIQTATVTVRTARASTDKGCVVNQAATTLAVVLSNVTAQPPQTMFYQLSLTSFCGAGPPERLTLCRTPPAGPAVYFPNNPFGTNDFLPLLGQPYPADGETRRIEVDLLPRLVKVIREGPEGIDRDPAHWVVGGVYAGQLIWGDVTMSSSWSDVRLIATTR